MNGYFKLFSGKIWLDFCEESELEVAGFYDRVNVFVHFKLIIKGYAKIFGGGTDVWSECVWGGEGQVGIMVKNDDLSFILV